MTNHTLAGPSAGLIRLRSQVEPVRQTQSPRRPGVRGVRGALLRLSDGPLIRAVMSLSALTARSRPLPRWAAPGAALVPAQVSNATRSARLTGASQPPATLPTNEGSTPADRATTAGAGTADAKTANAEAAADATGSQGDGPGDIPRPDDRAGLVARARRGDVDAFGELYDHYSGLVYRYALYRVAGNPVAAEDVVSETFLRAFRTITEFRWQGRDIGAWFVTIARNLMVDQARSARARFEFPTADILAAADHRDSAAAVPGPEESVLALATRRELWEAVRSLRPDQQECVALRFLEGLSVRETALAMRRNEGAIRALQFRAIRTLARALPAVDNG